MEIAARNVMTRRFGSLAPRVNRRCAVAIRAQYGPNSQPPHSASPAVPPGYQQQQFYQGSQYPGSYSGQPAPAPPAGYQGVGTNNLPFTPYQGPPPTGTVVNSGYAPPPPQNAGAPQYQPQQQLQQQQGAVGLARTNPGRDTQNSVTLQGRIKGPTLDRRCCRAVLEVPYSTKAGAVSFELDVWDDLGRAVAELPNETEVVVRGRLAKGPQDDVVRVRAYDVKIVDRQLQPSPLGGGQTSSGVAGPSKPIIPDKEVHHMHTTRESMAKDLARELQIQPGTVMEKLVSYAINQQAPLKYRVLAQEYGLAMAPGDVDSLTLGDLMDAVKSFKQAWKEGKVNYVLLPKETGMVAPVQQVSTPGSSPPVSKDGVLRLRILRDWILNPMSYCPAQRGLEALEKRRGLDTTYAVLKLAVAGEATEGVWSYAQQFPEDSGEAAV